MTNPRYHVLIVEDHRLNLEHYTRALTRRGYEVSAVTCADDARVELANRLPDIVLLDVFMPGVSGFDLLRELRADPRTRTLPVILISALGDTRHVVEGMERGASDYVTKPVVIPVLTARMEALLRASALVKRLEVQTELLARLAAYDELTGVYNRRSMFHALETEISRCQRYGRTLSVLMLDLDNFKGVNDQHGHAAGDAVLRDAARVIQGALRSMDVVCRYGGEEFCAILPETNVTGAVRAAERVREALEARTVVFGDRRLTVTASLGVASWTPAPGGGIPDLLAEADRALLEAKRNGRNQVRVSQREPLGNPGMN